MYKRINRDNHVCMFCGCDISDKIRKAKVCDNIECKKKLYNYEKEHKNDPRYCKICGCDISHLRATRHTCDNPECLKMYKSLYYKTLLYNKVCKYCNNEFIGTAKLTICNNCKKTVKRPINKEIFNQLIICSLCGKVIDIVQKYKSGRSKDVLYKICNDCKKENRKVTLDKISANMKQNNPMYNENIKEKSKKTHRENYINKCIQNGIEPRPILTIKSHKETKEETKLRMQEHNPMKNKKSVEKMKQTLQKHLLDGTLKYKRGKEHHLWKGNRNLNKIVRINLRKWVRHMFEISNYTCLNCGKTHTELHVHHLLPLRNIIDMFLTKYNYTIEYLNDIDGSDTYNEFINDIVLYHNNTDNIGIVVCPDCHALLDNQYKKRKNK